MIKYLLSSVDSKKKEISLQLEGCILWFKHSFLSHIVQFRETQLSFFSILLILQVQHDLRKLRYLLYSSIGHYVHIWFIQTQQLFWPNKCDKYFVHTHVSSSRLAGDAHYFFFNLKEKRRIRLWSHRSIHYTVFT